MDAELILLLSPLIVIQFALMIWAVLKVLPKKETKYLNRNIWMIIIVLVGILGPVAYLILEGDE